MSSMKWLGSFVFGSNCGIKRSLLWKAISDLKGQAVAKAWLIVGDFNVVKEKSEKYGWQGCHAFENEFSRWKCLITHMLLVFSLAVTKGRDMGFWLGN